jgi:isopentenyldiphosphate isomerase
MASVIPLSLRSNKSASDTFSVAERENARMRFMQLTYPYNIPCIAAWQPLQKLKSSIVNPMPKKVAIVDENDQVIGAMNRAEAVEQGKIVRIVRILLLNSKGELFIQKRAENVDYPGLWDQSAGGHVDEGEDYLTAAKRELLEEIGLKDVKLKEITRYYSEFEYKDRKRRRFNTLYASVSDAPLKLDPEELAGGKWVSQTELDQMMADNPQNFTKGFINAYNLYKNI